MAKPKRPGVPSTAPAAPATAKVPAPAPVKPAGGAAAGGAAPRKAAPSGGAPRNVPPPPPREEEDITLKPESVSPDMLRALVESQRAVQSGLKLAAEAQDRIGAQDRMYAERLARVEDLRKKGELGPRPVRVSMPGETRGAPTYVYPSARALETTVGRKSVRAGLSAPPQSPTFEELDTPIKGVRAAQEVGSEYVKAKKAYEATQRLADTVARDLYASGAERAAAADDTRRALERVARLRASLREYGWTDDKEVEEAFGLE